MLKALVFVLYAASASPLVFPAVDDQLFRPEYSGSRFAREGRQKRWMSESSRRLRRQNFVFPTKEIEDFLTSIRGKPSSDTIVFPGPSGKPFVPSGEFGYGSEDGPSTWFREFPFCGLKRQSPIDIDLSRARRPPSHEDSALFFNNYDALPSRLTVMNSGHSLRLTGEWAAGKRPTISGLALHGDYSFSEIHFHWGEDDGEGSEHMVQGRRFPLEMHEVHYKTEYGSFNESLKKRDGLVVISYLFNIGKHNHPLSRILKVSGDVVRPESPAVDIDPFRLDELAPPFGRNYAVYVGSLTTPPCTEIVTWIVNLEPQHVSSEQLQNLRGLMRSAGTRMLFNFRPVQSLNGRTVMRVP
ncbi:carbonic anhydrase 2-like [Ischnura elegans]|uniref:carbonic anhydrase 2-like n=1 Tax=Ischnura elegans TaxID=197161 RepID=UPI001ED87541|nr:carbonic anhydrase 2-like [Ischnura elegans]